MISIIIPLHWGLRKENFSRFHHDFSHFTSLDYKNYEILIVSDRKTSLRTDSKKVRHLVTNSKVPTSPAEKRDFALRYAKGQLCAFIDDDAYPDPQWLKRAVRWFVNPDVIAVGGAGVTPPEDGFWEKIGGHIIESYFCSGGIQQRFYVDENTPPAFVDDWPAYNLLIRSKSLKKVGGFNSTFYGGEDTYVCMRLDKMGLMVFEPKAIVYHHRRAFPVAHLKQIASVGIHRGYFFKAYPKTSRKLFYLMPTIMTCGLLLSIFLATYYLLLLVPFTLIFLSLWILAALSVYRHKADISESVLAGIGIILTHMCYGAFFVKGLYAKDLKR